MNEAIRVLIVEDMPTDAELAQREIKKTFKLCEFQSVDTQEDYLYVLQNFRPDIIVSDYRLPRFDGLTALKLAIERAPLTPVIILTSAINEDTAVECMKAGASDYVIKEHIKRLGQAMLHALEQKRLRKERQQAEHDLQMSEERYRDLVVSSNDWVWEVDVHGAYTYVGPQCFDILGYSPEELLGKLMADLMMPEEAKRFNELLISTFTHNQSFKAVVANRIHKDGHSVITESNGLAIIGKDGKICGCRGMDHDVTERRMAEKKLQESEELHRKLIASIPDVIIRTDIQGHIVFVNETSFPSWRYTPKEGLYGKNILSFVAPVDQQRAIENMQKMFEKPLGVIEYRLKFGEGIEVNGEINGDVLRDEQGTPYGRVFVMRDISERKQTEQALHESEGRYRSLFLSSPEAIILVGLDGKLIDVNPTAEAISGVSREKLLDRSFKELEMMQGEAGRLAAQSFTEVCHEGKSHPYSFEIRRTDGSARWVEVSTSMLKKNGENYAVQVLANDITERKINEAKLLQSEEQFRLISENVADLIIVIDVSGHVSYASPSYKNIFGNVQLSQETDWYEMIHPEDRHYVEESLRAVITAGNSKRIDVRFVGLKGSVHYIESQTNAIRNKEGAITSVVAVCRDVTEQKLLEQQFLRTQRLESLGTLAGGVAHDLNNVLSPILMAILTLKPHTDEKGVRILNLLESSALRGTEIVKQILGFARGVEGDRKPLQVRHLIKEMLSIANATFPKTIVMRNDIASDIWPVIGDATQIQQLLMNLCVNARDAMPDGGTITLTGENKIIDEHYARINIEAKPGRYVMFGVQDTGIGMPTAVLDRIFEPFFTTKEVGKGTGLGLSTVHTIVKSHKGFINVNSEVDKGTTFTFFLPATEASEQQQSVIFPKEQLQGHGELVLVIDDEVAISQIAKQTLEMHGYEVITVSDGTEAIDAYVGRVKDFDVVITDMIMPNMDGQKTIQALRKLNPHVKIIASSGYSNTGSVGALDDLNVNAFIVKPYTAEKLLETLRDVLSK